MIKKIVKSRKLTSKGLLLTFDDDCTCLLQPIKIETLKSIGGQVPNVGDTVNLTESTDLAGTVSAQWFDIAA